jgi:8-oxo-dGTP pyrophosphatase MutT (NUDIX family)
MKTLSEVVATLRARPPRVNASYKGPRAAVLIALTEEQPGAPVHVWLTVRAAHLRTNPGDVGTPVAPSPAWAVARTLASHAHDGAVPAFPGGKRDAADASDWVTALVRLVGRRGAWPGAESLRRTRGVGCLGRQREADEEVGLDPAAVDYVAQLDALLSRFGLLVTPFVAVVPWAFVPRLDPREVTAAFRVPLARFVSADPAVHWAVVWEEDDGSAQLSHMFALDNSGRHTVWGLTASLLLHLLEASAYAPLPYDVTLPGSESWFDRTLRHAGPIAATAEGTAEDAMDNPASSTPARL